MTILFDPNKQIAVSSISSVAQNQREQIKQELRERIHAALETAKDLPPRDCLKEIKDRLLAIQTYWLTTLILMGSASILLAA